MKKTQLEGQGKKIMLRVMVILGLLILSLSSISAQVWTNNLDNSLKVYYNFDEGGVSNATDNSGNNNTGLNNGDVTRVTGKLGNAINISLSTRWINFSNALSLNAGSNYTVSYWTYFDNITATQVIHRLGTGANGEQAMVLSNQYRWNRNGIGGVQTGTTANLTTWDFHTIVVNTTGIKWYVNTNNIYECSSSCRQLATDVGALIGSDSTNYMIGKIDEFALWNKTLNTTEISQLYNSGNGLTYGFGRIKNITVSLVSPEDNYTSNNSIINFYSQQVYGNILAGNSTLHVWNATGSLVKSNTTTTNITNGSSFSLTSLAYGNYYWNVLANDSTNTQKEYAFSNRTINIRRSYNITSYDYNTTAVTLTTEGYSINLTTSPGISIISAMLWYDGVGTTATVTTHTAGIYKISATKYLGTSFGSKNFFFLINYSDSTTENLTTATQTVNQFSLLEVGTTCSAGYNISYNFSFYDEKNRTAVNGTATYNFMFGVLGNNTLGQINGSVGAIKSFYLCTNSSLDYKIGYGEIQYTGDGYINKRFYLYENTTINNNTITQFLYQMHTTDATSFLYEIQDQTSLDPYTNVYLSLLRWYPEINSYNVVDMGKTDEKGQTVLRVKTEDIDYRLGVYYSNGTLIKLADPVRYVCLTSPCSYNLKVETTPLDYTDVYGVSYTLDYDNVTKVFTFTWNDPSQRTTAMNLTVYRISGTNDSAVCTTSLSSQTGTLTCNVSSYNGEFKAVAYRSASPYTPIAELISFSNKVLSSKTGLIISMLILLLIVLTGLFSPSVAIILSIVALIPSMIFGAINLSILIGIAVLVFVIAQVIRRDN